MKYRKFPRSTDQISVLGFGCMRFPTDPEGQIDIDESIMLLEKAYSGGVNYYDTAYPYHGGNSEPFLSKFISLHERSTLLLATKMPTWLIQQPDDMPRYLDEQLKRLDTDYIDYYLLHSLNSRIWPKLKRFNVIKFLENAQKEGKIRHIGFSFHDNYKTFKAITEAYDWVFCQIMLNYLDTKFQAGIKGYELAKIHNIGVIAMEPLRGGKLVSPIPTTIEKYWAKHRQKDSMVSKALKWVWNLPNVQTLLSGMTTMAQLDENLALASDAESDILSDDELKLYAKIRSMYIKRIQVRCTECRYCLPCPFGVAIPGCFGMYNEAMMFDDIKRSKKEYNMFIPESARATNCTECGACLPKCPQGINIPTELKKVNQLFL